MSEQKPLVVCLVAALALGISDPMHAADRVDRVGHGIGRPEPQRARPTQPADLPLGSRKRAAWERALSRPRSPDDIPTITVTNCNDSGPGSLRDAAGAIGDIGIIDLTQLTCSVITLTTGAVTILGSDIVISGRGIHETYIDAGYSRGYHSSAIYDLSGGTLHLFDLTVTDASYDGYREPAGGCIYSLGGVTLDSAAVTYCHINPPPGTTEESAGGAIYARDYTYLRNGSSVSFGFAYSPAGDATGGAIFTGAGGLAMRNSLISNSSVRSGHHTSHAGAAFVAGSMDVRYSAIVDNYSDHNIGGIEVSGKGANYSSGLLSSTISQNVAANAGAGIYSAERLNCENSTVAFNSEQNEGAYNYAVASGVDVYNAYLSARSCIFSNNIVAQSGTILDISGAYSYVIGHNNLIMAAAVTVPPDTLYQDPQLAPLAFNGGPTPTHALAPTSPAIDRGYAPGVVNDQRGPGFPRVIGANADIGAFELGESPIFANGFD